MRFEVTNHVPGVSEEHLAALVDDAERGYDLASTASEVNPHALVVPVDLCDAIAARAERDGESPESVLRQALDAYLGTA